MNYNEYMNSPEWEKRRLRILKRDNLKCQICGSGKNLRVHHIRYPEILGTEPDSDLITVCDTCHARIHYEDKNYGRAPSPWQANLSRRRTWVNEAKYRDFIYGGTYNMCKKALCEESLAEFNELNYCETNGISYLMHPLGWAHWKLVNEMFKRGYSIEEIEMITPLERQTIRKYLSANRAGEENNWNCLIPIEELKKMVGRFIQEDIDGRKQC